MDNIEIWKDIPGFNYRISNFGNVKSLSYQHTGKDKIIKPFKNTDGYLIIALYKNGKRFTPKIHRLVAIAFLPNPNNLPQVNHKDENKTNNYVWVNPDGTVDLEKSNLEWVSAKQNSNHGSRNQRIGKTLSKPIGQYLGEKLIATYPSIKEAAKQTGFNSGHISECCNGKRKTHAGFIWRYL